MSGIPRWAPVDSQEARERRETAQEADEGTSTPPEAPSAASRLHDELCRDRWLGLDDEERPIACPRCRPHLFAAPCVGCALSADRCDEQLRRRRGRCCDACDHSRVDELRFMLDHGGQG